MVDVGKREDALLEKLHAVCLERDAALISLAAERVAHRITRKELAEATELAIRV